MSRRRSFSRTVLFCSAVTALSPSCGLFGARFLDDNSWEPDDARFALGVHIPVPLYNIGSEGTVALPVGFISSGDQSGRYRYEMDEAYVGLSAWNINLWDYDHGGALYGGVGLGYVNAEVSSEVTGSGDYYSFSAYAHCGYWHAFDKILLGIELRYTLGTLLELPEGDTSLDGLQVFLVLFTAGALLSGGSF